MSEMRLCATHKKLRLEKLLVAKNVLDADGNVIDVRYSCTPETECTNTSFVGRAPAGPSFTGSLNNNSSSATGSTGGPSAELSDAMKLYGGREVRGRYYDLANADGGIDNSVKKVCFVCGQSDHERGDCPNQFCRQCRQVVPPGGLARHECQGDAPLSDFVDLRTPTAEELRNVRCTVCNNLGHLDCAPLGPNRFRVTCCSCGDVGHHGLQCLKAPTDRWLNGQLRTLARTLEQRARQPKPQPPKPSQQQQSQSQTKDGETEKKSRGSNRKKNRSEGQTGTPASSPREAPLKQHTAESGSPKLAVAPQQQQQQPASTRRVVAEVPTPASPASAAGSRYKRPEQQQQQQQQQRTAEEHRIIGF